jgi:predicted nucleotidyltransferase
MKKAQIHMQTSLVHLTNREREAVGVFMHKLQQQFDGQLLSVILFGSRARGDAQPDSDIDLIVVLKQDNPESRRAVHYLAVETLLEYGLYVSARVWSQTHWCQLKDMQTGLYRNLQREGIELFSASIETA